MLGEKNYLELLNILGFNDEVVLETTKKEKGGFLNERNIRKYF